MYKICLALLCVVISTMLFLSSVTEAAPSTNKVVNFQGRLQTAAGAVVPDGYYNMQFKIYQDGPGNAVGNPGGTLNWTESYVNNGGTSGVKVKNGLFSVSLGSQNAFGDSVDWSQDTLWLSMNIAGSSQTCSTFGSSPCLADGEMLPMKRISAVPYAIAAGSVGGKAAEDLVQLGQGTQTDGSDNASIAINKTGAGDLVNLQSSGADAFKVASSGSITMGSSTAQSISVADNATGAGQSLTISAGGSTSGDEAGGDLVLAAGSGSGTGSDGSIIMNGNVTIGAGNTITMVGGTTSLRPASPTDGTMYFDSETKQLLVYKNGKWNGGNSNSLRTIAASNSSRSSKDSADFIADGSDDQTEIQSAIAALPSEGGTVALLGGTYNISSTVSISKSNITLLGQGGKSTTLKRVWNSATDLEGVVTIPSGYNQINLKGLYIDGNKSAYSSTNNHGIRIGNLDAACGSSVNGVVVDSNYISNTGGSGIRFGGGVCKGNHSHNIINNIITGSGVDGIKDYSGNVDNTNIVNNITQSSTNSGISVRGNGLVIERNKTTSNGTYGISSTATVINNYVSGNLSGGVDGATVLRGNTICDNTGNGYSRTEGVVNLIEGNIICNNTSNGIRASGSSLRLYSVSDNDIYGNGTSGISTSGGSQHTIKDNSIRDNGGSGSSNSIEIGQGTYHRVIDNTISDTVGTGCAIRITSSTVDSQLSNNQFSGPGASCISDAGTNTSYVNQRDAAGKLINRSSGGFGVQTSSGSDAMTINATSGEVAVAGSLKAGSLATASVDTATAGNLALAATNATSVTIGTSDANATTLVLDTKTSTGDPTGVNGAMYYNSSAGKFRCYQSGSWQDCVTPLPVYKTITTSQSFNDFAVDVTGMSFPLAANTKYQYKFVIQHNGSNGAGFGITSPSGSTGTNWCINATVRSPLPAAGQSSTAYCGTGDASTVISNSSLPGNSFVSIMEGYVETTGTPGDLVLRGKSTIDGATVSSGTFGVVQIVR